MANPTETGGCIIAIPPPILHQFLEFLEEIGNFVAMPVKVDERGDMVFIPKHDDGTITHGLPPLVKGKTLIARSPYGD